MHNDKLLEKYKTIWIKIEDLRNIEFNVLPIYDDRYVKTKIKSCGYIVYTNFPGLNMSEDDVECKKIV